MRDWNMGRHHPCSRIPAMVANGAKRPLNADRDMAFSLGVKRAFSAACHPVEARRQQVSALPGHGEDLT